MDKVNEITSSVVDMTQKIDSTTRAVESALATPAKKRCLQQRRPAGGEQHVQRFRGGAEPAGNGPARNACTRRLSTISRRRKSR